MNEFQIIEGEALEVLREIPTESVDSMVTDPPAGISFMSKNWDHDHGGRQEWVASFSAIFSESLRVLRPGAHALVWAIPRTSHWTATALEDAGFEIRDVVVHLFGTGFPKSANVSKMIDKAAGAEREVVGRGKWAANREPGRAMQPTGQGLRVTNEDTRDITAPATEAARTWEGWGTALKPAAEHWILCRKPLKGTVAGNVIEHGTGALNVDGCRIGSESTKRTQNADGVLKHGGENSRPHHGNVTPKETGSPSGRWPANVVFSHDSRCVLVGEKRVKIGSGGAATRKDADVTPSGDMDNSHPGADTPAYQCVPECAVRLLDEQSGELTSGAGLKDGSKRTGMRGNPAARRGPEYNTNTGTASRFFKVFDAPRDCWICGVSPSTNHGTMTVPCEPANDAKKSTAVRESGSVHDGVQPTKLHAREARGAKQNSSAGNAGSRSPPTKARPDNTALGPVTTTPGEQSALHAGCAGGLCEICATSIVPALAGGKHSRIEESLAGLDSISEHRRRILILSHALAVESLGSTDTISTTATLSAWSGFALRAIEGTTKREFREPTTKIGPTRLRYCSKPSTRERDIGGVTNRHPTVKSAELMAYFCRLVTPPGGTVLDPFCGSGSTGIAALREGFDFIGIEREEEDAELARRRIEGDSPLFNRERDNIAGGGEI